MVYDVQAAIHALINGGDFKLPLACWNAVMSASTVFLAGVYFSAHWCPPCRAFTPKLGQYYEEQKKGPNADKFEIVFVSCDRDDDSFKDYFKTMPFLAVDFGAEEAVS